MDLKIINFGRLDAESDKSLMDYFVEIGSIKSILEGKHLVIGRKGSGKTAIFRYLELQLPKKNICTINLELDNYYFSSHKQLKETGVPENNSYYECMEIIN
jgi:sll1717 protein